MKDQFIEAWRINNRVNLLLIDAISEEGLACKLSKRGGRSVALQFAHLHNVRLSWLRKCARELYAGQTMIGKEGPVGRDLLKARLEESGEAIAALIERAVADGGQIAGFSRGIVPLLGFMTAHDAHHRGSILLTLKQCGHRIDLNTQYGIWEWDHL